MHECYMEQALALAREAAQAGEVPVGCVIVRAGAVVGRGRNRREEKRSALSHAEMEAIAQANRNLGSWRLEDCELYVTLEPCRGPGPGHGGLRRGDEPVHGGLPQPARPGGRHPGIGLRPGAQRLFSGTAAERRRKIGRLS